jgi:nitroreductase
MGNGWHHMKEIENYPQLANLFNRRSIRKFTTQQVPAEWIEVILKAGMAAPSANNNQPCEFIVIDEPEMLEKVRRVMPFGREHAPLAIAVCGNKLKARKNITVKDFWIQDCSAAAENILSAATGLGLGSVWLGVHPIILVKQSVTKLLGLPRHVDPLCIIYIGFPAEEKEPHNKYNTKNVFWQHYGMQKQNPTDKA